MSLAYDVFVNDPPPRAGTWPASSSPTATATTFSRPVTARERPGEGFRTIIRASWL